MHPIIPFEDLPLGVQIFLVLTSVFILVGIGSILWQMIRAIRDKRE